MIKLGTRHSEANITVNYYPPLLTSNLTVSQIAIGGYDNFKSWSHSINAYGGFDTASFEVAATQPEMEDWFENGLGRRVHAYDEGANVVWEGFVDSVKISHSGLEWTRGSLLDIGNRVLIWYSGFDFTAAEPDAPVPGIRKPTPAADSLPSQEKYGIVYKILSAAGVTDADAIQLRDTFLLENAEPITTSRYTNNPAEPTITIGCRGYFHWLIYPYNNSTTTATTVSAKIKSILNADPNDFISTDHSEIVDNSLAVSAWETDSRKANEIIKGMTAMGDTSFGRMLFGIYENRKAYYTAAPTDPYYHVHLKDVTRGIFRHPSDEEVYPWAVRPGRWVQFNDFLPGLPITPGNMRLDPRNMFVESVEFQAPNQITMNGGRLTKFDQKIARLGLSGVAA